MNKRPGQIKVTMETGYCSFCDRTRNLRREERHLGTFVRTILACETCHRILSSSMGVASAETPVAAQNSDERDAVVEPTVVPSLKPETKPVKRAATSRSNAAAGAPKATKSRAPKTR
jgi:hypothetical protein